MSFSLFNGANVTSRSIRSAGLSSQCVRQQQQQQQQQCRSIAIASAIYKGVRRDTSRRDAGARETAHIRSESRERLGKRVKRSYDDDGGPSSSSKPPSRASRPRRTSPQWETGQSADQTVSFETSKVRPLYAAVTGTERQPERSVEQGTARSYERGQSSDRKSGTSSYSTEKPPYERRRTQRTFDRRRQEGSHDRRSSTRTPGGGAGTGADKTSYPMSVPHTTAASQFLYGYSTVYAALRAARRKSYTLYIHSRGTARDEATNTSSPRSARDGQAAKERSSVMKLARDQKVEIVGEKEVDIRLLDKMSDGRPHNGIVLEASPLPIHATTSLVWSGTENSTLLAALSTGSTATLDSLASKPYPFVLFIDDVLDPGNLGAILRSAYFLGVDAVLLTGHVAPFNAVLLKASAGAAEAMPIFRIEDPTKFLKQSKEDGWGVVCATTPTTKKSNSPAAKVAAEVAYLLDKVTIPITHLESNVRYHVPGARNEPHINKLFADRPQILIIGGEGRGLRPFIIKAAESFVEVLSPRKKEIAQVGLDSLNVSVAAGVVIQEVLARIRKGWKKNLEVQAKARLEVESDKEHDLVEEESRDLGQEALTELPALPSELDGLDLERVELPQESSEPTGHGSSEVARGGNSEEASSKLF